MRNDHYILVVFDDVVANGTKERITPLYNKAVDEYKKSKKDFRNQPSLYKLIKQPV